MNLQPITGPAFAFKCYGCERKCTHPKPITHANEPVADLDGPPFEAYYCGPLCARAAAMRTTEPNAQPVLI